jgi:hypothetical protein
MRLVKAVAVACSTTASLALLSLNVSATTPEKCHHPDSECTRANTCTAAGYDSSTCQIGIVRSNLSGDRVSPTIDGLATPSDFFCIAQGARVTWATVDADSFGDVRFDGMHPFDQASFGVDSATSFQHTASNGASDSVCYTFAVSECKYIVKSTGDCSSTDPKVIVVGGPGLTALKKRLKHPEGK